MVASPNTSATDPVERASTGDGGVKRRGRWDPASRTLAPRGSAPDGEPEGRGRSPVASAATAYATAAERYDELHRQWSAAVERERELGAQRDEAATALREARARLDDELRGLEGDAAKPKHKGGRRPRQPRAEGEGQPAEAPAAAEATPA